MPPTAPSPWPDLVATRHAIRTGATSAPAQIEAAIAAAGSPAGRDAFVATDFPGARAAAHAARPDTPLAGLTVSVKDLFDVAGQTTAAGSRVLADAPPARKDSPAAARLRAAGAAVVGRTHMVEFAFAGVGTNPHAATPANPAFSGEARIPGGSSSGAGVSVGTGAAFIGLGSDTGGSIRIPAALCGLVGFKSTARLVPTAGVYPLSPTLDTVCAVTRSVRDAVVAHEVLADRTVPDQPRPLSDCRLAVPRTVMLDDLEPAVAVAFDRAVALLRRAGARIDELPLAELAEPAALQTRGSIVAAEAWRWHRTQLEARPDAYDPRVASRLRKGAALGDAELADLLGARLAWIDRMASPLAPYDALLSPTVAITAPTIASVLASDTTYFRVNAQLLRNTSLVNFLDGCALSLPCHAAGEPPVGLMLWHGALHDDALLNVALAVETALASALGPTMSA